MPGTRQQPVPVIFLGTAMIDKAIDGLMTDDCATLFTRQPASDLFRRPSHRKAIPDLLLQCRLARQFMTTVPSPSPQGQTMGPGRLVTAIPDLGLPAVSVKLTTDCRWGAPHRHGYRPNGFPRPVQAVNLYTLVKAELPVFLSHRNTNYN